MFNKIFGLPGILAVSFLAMGYTVFEFKKCYTDRCGVDICQNTIDPCPMNMYRTLVLVAIVLISVSLVVWVIRRNKK